MNDTKEKDSGRRAHIADEGEGNAREGSRRYNDGGESATRRCLGRGGKGKSETSSLETGALLANREEGRGYVVNGSGG